MAIYWDVKKGVWYVRAFCVDHRGARQHNNKHSFPVKAGRMPGKASASH